MAESNDTGALLISCGNETEIALGYATLYGDMCGGISLIGDLSKMDVYRLARHVNQRHGAEMIPEETFRITPVSGARRRTVRPVRLLGCLAGRRRNRGAAGQPGGPRRSCSSAGRSTRSASRPTIKGARSTTNTPSTASGPSCTTSPAPCGAPSTSASRGHPSSSSANAHSGSICARRSSTSGMVDTDDR